MQEQPVFRSQEEYDAYVLKELEDSEREAADPNTKWVTWEEFREAVEAKLYEPPLLLRLSRQPGLPQGTRGEIQPVLQNRRGAARGTYPPHHT